MAVTIAKLATVATLDATKFSAGLTKMTTSMGAFSAISLGAFGKIGASITSMLARGLSSIPRLATAGLALGDALSDSSKATGIAADRLATYHRAARLAGLGASEFDSMIGRLNVNIAEAVQGDKKFAGMLSKVGVDLAKISSLSPDETFLALADAVSKTSSAFDRAFIAQQAFGKGGFRLLPLLSGGRGGISSLMGSTRALGAAPSNAQVQTIERANDALQDLGTAFTGLKLKIAQDISPALEKFSTGLLKALGEHKLIPRMGSGFAGAIQGLATAANPSLAGVGAAYSHIAGAVEPEVETAVEAGPDTRSPGHRQKDARRATILEQALKNSARRESLIDKAAFRASQLKLRLAWPGDRYKLSEATKDERRTSIWEELQADNQQGAALRQSQRDRDRGLLWNIATNPNPFMRGPGGGIMDNPAYTGKPFTAMSRTEQNLVLKELAKQTALLERISRQGGGGGMGN